MIYKDTIIGSTISNSVSMNDNELRARLGKGINLDDEIIKKYMNIYFDKVSFRFAYTRIPFTIENEICYFENEAINSKSLLTVLKDCKEVILLAVTSGIEIDKLISKISILNPPEALYIDAISSAGIESYMDYINEIICQDLDLTKRFSPGYSDFPIEFQAYLLSRLSAQENIGISLSKDFLMIPTKSITAVIGIK